MKFPKMVKHLLAGEKITRNRWIRDDLGYIIIKDDKILSIDKYGDAMGEWDDDSRFCMEDMRKKGWRIYNESD